MSLLWTVDIFCFGFFSLDLSHRFKHNMAIKCNITMSILLSSFVAGPRVIHEEKILNTNFCNNGYIFTILIYFPLRRFADFDDPDHVQDHKSRDNKGVKKPQNW